MQKTIESVTGIYGINAQGNFVRMPGYGSSFHYEADKHLLEDNRSKIQNQINPPDHDRSKAYEKDLTHGKPYFAGE